MSKDSGNKLESPKLPNNFSAKKPADARAPMIGSRGFKPSPNDNNRGKDGTR